jgi:4-hydroxy-3-methylbut-2-enyl diphosphate reductase
MMSLGETSVEKIILAEPRGFCAGVDRAVEAVRGALRSYGRPLYVRHQIVHNRFVLEALEAEGAIFVDSLDAVPEGQRVIFSAHGVAPSEWDHAKDRRLRVIDATCPLVTKVHDEVERYANEGRTVVLVGHQGHEEVKGTLGVAPGKVVLVGSVEEARACEISDPSRCAAVTQTTLSVDDTREIMETLKTRFPAMLTPKTDDICYATQNRQNAVKELVAVSDAVLVVGSKQSSNANRLVEVARQRGARAFLVDSLADVEDQMLAGVKALGLTASASSPEWLVEEIIGAFANRGAAVELMSVAKERVHFPLPMPADLSRGHRGSPALTILARCLKTHPDPFGRVILLERENVDAKSCRARADHSNPASASGYQRMPDQVREAGLSGQRHRQESDGIFSRRSREVARTIARHAARSGQGRSQEPRRVEAARPARRSAGASG